MGGMCPCRTCLSSASLGGSSYQDVQGPCKKQTSSLPCPFSAPGDHACIGASLHHQWRCSEEYIPLEMALFKLMHNYSPLPVLFWDNT